METRYKQPTKKVKRKKLNVARTLVFFLFIYLIVCVVLHIYKVPIKHYVISGNDYLSDADILEYGDLVDYPALLSINTRSLEKKLETNDFIKDAKVSYGWHFYLKIEIEENKPMLYEKNGGSLVLEDGTLIDDEYENLNIPVLLNDTPEDILKTLISKLSKVSDGILSMVSEIEYDPSYNSDGDVIDKYRFLLYMSDDNLVYITAKRANLLDKYLDVIATSAINGKGTLYLDGDEDRYSFKYFPDQEIKDVKKEEETVVDSAVSNSTEG